MTQEGETQKFTVGEIREGCADLWGNVECMTCSRLLGYIKRLLGSRVSAVSPSPVVEPLPLCPVHKGLDQRHDLELEIGGNNCVACSLNERRELLGLIAPFAAEGNTEDSVTVLRRVTEFYETHAGEGRVVVSYPAASPVADPVDVETTDETVAAFNRHLAQRHEELAAYMKQECAKALDLIEQYTRPDFYMWLLHDYAGQKSDPYKRAADSKAILSALIESVPSNRVVETTDTSIRDAAAEIVTTVVGKCGLESLPPDVYHEIQGILTKAWRASE